jgi:hypothetical protein
MQLSIKRASENLKLGDKIKSCCHSVTVTLLLNYETLYCFSNFMTRDSSLASVFKGRYKFNKNIIKKLHIF